ncbi:MAG: 1-deoxy-D-xylulose-5-phosphate reductoisomerase [Candidatus Aquicultor primus]|uniref:1-deoxy-D-xylulose 5-phosphate reductoisomerase n=1 Tax=Candidatus Aquicultor primus TaxID=1797195 RepID=A0A1F2UMA0_9ACTN|nr:MAG: 1-deoxy-D-xylulose-5-phosphate reductoisomerase [Candidatus Aquicultor primus]HCG98836.1 1-deoxy-D-xylulose-5-phosphate reductoisomerase [Actinomycetota bacterium]
MKNIVILGSSGSIGLQTIDIVKRYPEHFNVVGLSVHRNTDVLEAQIGEFRPKVVVVADEESAKSLKGKDLGDVEVMAGIAGLEELAAYPGADIVLNALVGSVGLRPTIATLKAGKVLALANKESMVAGGAIVNRTREETDAVILPVDSEHNALFQCIVGESEDEIEKLILTASGGPFRGRTREELGKVTVEEALAHPRWVMGPKITIDSATLMNKGLEVIEAHWLFRIPYERIEVVVHPQSIIHSMVEYTDGSIKAHLGRTDMRIPIQYTLSYPERLPSPVPPLSFIDVAQLTFEAPDYENFPCLKFAFEAAKAGGTYPAALNAANEEAVDAFLNKRIGYLDIPRVIRGVLDCHESGNDADLGIILEVEEWARRTAGGVIESLER